jgi:hypothetical protein
VSHTRTYKGGKRKRERGRERVEREGDRKRE